MVDRGIVVWIDVFLMLTMVFYGCSRCRCKDSRVLMLTMAFFCCSLCRC